MNPLILIFQIIVLIFSVIIHEISHGFIAYKLGDNTAKDAGRLTLNPLKHIDPFGSVLLPLMLFVIQSPVLFGWAKPVPFNPVNLKNQKRDSGLIGLAGPASNYLVAIVFSIFASIVPISSLTKASLSMSVLTGVNLPVSTIESVYFFFMQIILVNVALGTFNLIPIPPLDGSKVLFAILPKSFGKFEAIFEQYGFFVLLFFIFFGFQLVIPVILAIYRLLGGSLL